MLAFRRAVSADIGQLHALIERAYRGDTARIGWTHEADLLGGQRTDVETLIATLGDPARRIFIAECDGQFSGCVEIAKVGLRRAYVGLVTVDPSLQAAGIGRALLAEAERVAASVFGAKVVEMTVIEQRVELIEWYQRRGYRLTGERRPFPHGDARYGLPKTDALRFVVLERAIATPPAAPI